MDDIVQPSELVGEDTDWEGNLVSEDAGADLSPEHDSQQGVSPDGEEVQEPPAYQHQDQFQSMEDPDQLRRSARGLVSDLTRVRTEKKELSERLGRLESLIEGARQNALAQQQQAAEPELPDPAEDLAGNLLGRIQQIDEKITGLTADQQRQVEEERQSEALFRLNDTAQSQIDTYTQQNPDFLPTVTNAISKAVALTAAAQPQLSEAQVHEHVAREFTKMKLSFAQRGLDVGHELMRIASAYGPPPATAPQGESPPPSRQPVPSQAVGQARYRQQHAASSGALPSSGARSSHRSESVAKMTDEQFDTYMNSFEDEEAATQAMLSRLPPEALA